ncbi:MAG: DUF2157 domain-containing protein [Woeseiaceae bacterium]|nr:DUF2157 domain-containing protein [Woeseiaceae bacterium]
MLIRTRLRDRDDDIWRLWALRALLVLGAAHFLAGVVFFFAYNWDDLGPFARFGLLQGALIVALVAAFAAGLHRPAGQALLIAASVITGVLFGVIGQVYQTGADAWELFAAWTVLVLPWLFASRSSAHWFLWCALALTAFSAYGDQVLIPMGVIAAGDFMAVAGALVIAFLVLVELVIRAGVGWLDQRWMRVSLALVGLAILLIPAIGFVLEGDGDELGFAMFLVAAGALGYIYARVLPEFAVVAIATGFAALLAMVAGGRVIFEIVGTDGEAGSLVMGLLMLLLWCGFLTASTVRLLNLFNRQMAARGRGD